MNDAETGQLALAVGVDLHSKWGYRSDWPMSGLQALYDRRAKLAAGLTERAWFAYLRIASDLLDQFRVE